MLVGVTEWFEHETRPGAIYRSEFHQLVDLLTPLAEASPAPQIEVQIGDRKWIAEDLADVATLAHEHCWIEDLRWADDRLVVQLNDVASLSGFLDPIHREVAVEASRLFDEWRSLSSAEPIRRPPGFFWQRLRLVWPSYLVLLLAMASASGSNLADGALNTTLEASAWALVTIAYLSMIPFIHRARKARRWRLDLTQDRPLPEDIPVSSLVRMARLVVSIFRRRLWELAGITIGLAALVLQIVA